MHLQISSKSDLASVNKIIALGYPENQTCLDHLLSWTCDPNWPVAAPIYQYFLALGKAEVQRVLALANRCDQDWRYSLITALIAHYDDEVLAECVESLRHWASETGAKECDFESIRILTDRELIPAEEIAEIVKRNLFVYNVWIKETLSASERAVYSLPLGSHTL